VAWTDTARRQHMRNGPGYPSDLRDGEWALIEPMLPPARSGGRPRTTFLRAVMDAILYIASSGCAWRMLPKCFPPISTVRGYFYDWRDSGLLTTINHLLVMTARQQSNTMRGLSSAEKYRQVPSKFKNVKIINYCFLGNMSRTISIAC